MIDKTLDSITEEDLQGLIQNAIPEKKNLEYKAEIPLNSDREKIRFLADISSFANANGGDLYIGIVEDREKGIPQEIRGVKIENPDKEILRIESLIRDGITPRLSPVEIRCLKMLNENFIILLRIQPSWMSPHRVILKGHDKFYSRNSAGKYQMDVDELRNAFTLADTVRKNISNFRTDRIFKIEANETPVLCYESAKTIFHLIPLVSLSRPISFEIKSLVRSPDILNKMQPMGHTAHERRYNFDGYLTYSIGQENKASSYFQFYRNGIIESVEAYWLSRDKYIQIASLERGIIESLSDYLILMRGLRIPVPIFMFLTLVGVKDHRIPPSRDTYLLSAEHMIGRDILQLRELIIEDYPTKVDAILKPIFDSLWNAGGYSEDPYYAEDGTWSGPGS
jgi:hypothetical protein